MNMNMFVDARTFRWVALETPFPAYILVNL
jgi:hypothetical protein